MRHARDQRSGSRMDVALWTLMALFSMLSGLWRYYRKPTEGAGCAWGTG